MKYALGIFILLPFMMFLPWIFMSAADNSDLMSTFTDMPTLLSFIIVIFTILIVTGEFKTFVKSVSSLFSKKYVISDTDREKGIKLFEFLTKVVIYAAAFHLVAGIAAILGRLDNLDMLGPLMSTALLSVLYAALINLAFFLPMTQTLKNRRPHEVITVISEKQVINKMLELCYKQGISPEEIINADEINFRKQ